MFDRSPMQFAWITTGPPVNRSRVIMSPASSSRRVRGTAFRYLNRSSDRPATVAHSGGSAGDRDAAIDDLRALSLDDPGGRREKAILSGITRGSAPAGWYEAQFRRASSSTPASPVVRDPPVRYKPAPVAESFERHERRVRGYPEQHCREHHDVVLRRGAHRLRDAVRPQAGASNPAIAAQTMSSTCARLNTCPLFDPDESVLP
jgi:hypothetical protein